MQSKSNAIVKNVSAAILLTACGVLAIGIAAKSETLRPATHCELQAVTQSGDLYILGSGDSCSDAFMNHAPIPSDWHSVKYVTVK